MIRAPRRFAVPFAWGFVVLVACGAPPGPEIDPTTPGGTVQRFFGLLGEGLLDDALALCTDQVRLAFDERADLERWADQITRQGTIRAVRISGSATDGDTATVDFEIEYDGGDVDRRTVELALGEAGWRLGLVL